MARSAANAHHETIYAVNPHKIFPEEGYIEGTEADFRNHLAKASVDNQIVPLIMTSEQAVEAGTSRFGCSGLTAIIPSYSPYWI